MRFFFLSNLYSLLRNCKGGGRGQRNWGRGEGKIQFLEIKPAPPLQLISIRESPNQTLPVHEVRTKYNTYSLNYFPSRP